MNAEQLNAIKERVAKATHGPWYHNRHNEISTPNGARLAQAVTGVDTEFIAYAREDVPALVAKVARLRAELADIIAVATEEASSLSYESGYEDIVKIANDALK